jgi:hypothetical protein
MDDIGGGFREALTKLDTGEADVIVMPEEPEIAAWARQHGYQVDAEPYEGVTMYTIRPGDPGLG